jgi:hypothetical protein
MKTKKYIAILALVIASLACTPAPYAGKVAPELRAQVVAVCEGKGVTCLTDSGLGK